MAMGLRALLEWPSALLECGAVLVLLGALYGLRMIFDPALRGDVAKVLRLSTRRKG